MHARRSKKVSRLGEFLDHWFDALHVPLLCTGIIHAMQFSSTVDVHYCTKALSEAITGDSNSIAVAATAAAAVISVFVPVWIEELFRSAIAAAAAVCASLGIILSNGVVSVIVCTILNCTVYHSEMLIYYYQGKWVRHRCRSNCCSSRSNCAALIIYACRLLARTHCL